jgi:hypothetical protein
MCANELAEVRKLVKTLTQTQIAIERIILRLETIKELSTIMIDLKPALTALKRVTSNLVNTMPDIALELDKVNDSIQETLTVTKLSSEQPIIHSNLKTPAGQEILSEVSAVLEQRVAEKLPEPPTAECLNEPQQSEQNIREMVALAVGCPESSETKEETSEAILSIKDVKMQSISLRIKQGESLEAKLLDYIKQRRGQIDLTECAIKLKTPPKEVERTLKKLGEEGKIIIGT